MCLRIILLVGWFMYSVTSECAAIIFDLGGVLFCYQKHVVHASLQGKLTGSPFQPVLKMVQVVQRCHAKVDAQGNRVHQLYILSNFSLEAFKILKHFHQPILDLFDGIVLSSQVGYSKPDKRIYEYLLHKYQLSAPDCIFIDDEPRKVHAAQALNMRGIVGKDAATVELALKQYGIL